MGIQDMSQYIYIYIERERDDLLDQMDIQDGIRYLDNYQDTNVPKQVSMIDHIIQMISKIQIVSWMESIIDIIDFLQKSEVSFSKLADDPIGELVGNVVFNLVDELARNLDSS